MKNIEIKFNVKALPFYAAAKKDEISTFELKADEEKMTVSVMYDYKEIPLVLSCKVKIGDRVSIILCEHIIKLYVNGELKDEEWPFGNRLFNLGDSLDGNSDISVNAYTEVKTEQPSVISSFENAEGWRPGGGIFVGDCMPYRRGEEYRTSEGRSARQSGVSPAKHLPISL